MEVTVRERVEAYYSEYAGNPVCLLEPNMAGVIAAIDVPYVRRFPGNSETFACVDFIHTIPAQDGRTEWQAGVDPKNLVPLGKPKASLCAAGGRCAGGGVPWGIRMDGLHGRRQSGTGLRNKRERRDLRRSRRAGADSRGARGGRVRP
jgi:hypothetical protein